MTFKIIFARTFTFIASVIKNDIQSPLNLLYVKVTSPRKQPANLGLKAGKNAYRSIL
jgi:hypothetical protein